MGAIISWGRDAGLTRRNGFSPCRNRPVAGRAGPFSPRPGRHRAATGQRRIRRRPRRSARPAGRPPVAGGQARQPVRGRLGQPPLLGRADAGRRAAEARVAAARTSTNQHRAVAHGQIDLAVTAGQVARQQDQAARLQQAQRGVVGVADALGGRARRGAGLRAVARRLPGAARAARAPGPGAGSRRSCGLQGGRDAPGGYTGMVFRLSCPQ